MKRRNTIIIWIVAAILIIAAVLIPIYSISTKNNTIAWMGKTPLKVADYKYYLYSYVSQVEQSRNLSSSDTATKTTFWTSQMADGKTAADYYKDLALQQYKKVMISVLKAKESKPPLTVPQEIKDKYDASFTKLINDNFSGKRIDADKAAVAELGVNIDQFKQLLYDQYLSQQFDDKYFNDAVARLLPDVTEADAQASYDADPTGYNTYTVAHILILTVDPTTGTALSNTAIQDAYTRATELQTKINNGESLADLAAQYSEDSGTKNIGGIFSFNKLSTKIDPYIISWAQSAEPGVLSIQQSNAGFHVIRLDKSEATPFASIVEDIRNEIASKKADDEMTAWTTDPKYDLNINAAALSKISVIR